MDLLFLLSPEARGRFLSTAARTLGCTYICLWSYLPQPSDRLVSVDGWFEDTQPSSSSGSFAQRLFESYRSLFCSLESRCVPGLAYKEGFPYIELHDSDLWNAASTNVQQQFYQEAGIRTAVFMGCKSGVTELGMSTLDNYSHEQINYMQSRIQSIFSEDTIQQFGEVGQHDQSRPSSSTSSLRSLSVGSPEYSSLVLAKPVKEAHSNQITSILPYIQNFPTPSTDDAVMTRAILAVLSSSSAASSTPSLLYHPPVQQDLTYLQRQMRRPRLGAFKPYDSTGKRKIEFKPNMQSQKMIKLAISISRKANMMRLGTLQEERPTTANQLHHMISERKRREKLNESFNELKMLIPAGSKKDKASVLSKTRDYINTLRAQISELEERNKMLENQQPLPTNEANDVGDARERVQVTITRASESTSEIQHINMRVIVRMECDMISFVLHILDCFKEMRAITVKSVDASAYSLQEQTISQATLTIQVKTTDWDEDTFKEAVIKAVVDGIEQSAAMVSPS